MFYLICQVFCIRRSQFTFLPMHQDALLVITFLALYNTLKTRRLKTFDKSSDITVLCAFLFQRIEGFVTVCEENRELSMKIK